MHPRRAARVRRVCVAEVNGETAPAVRENDASCDTVTPTCGHARLMSPYEGLSKHVFGVRNESCLKRETLSSDAYVRPEPARDNGSEPPARQAPVVAALTALAQAVSKPFDTEAIESAAMAAPLPGDALDDVVAAGDRLGLRMRWVEASAERVCRGDSALLPAVTSDTRGQLVVVLSASRSGVRVLGPAGYVKPRRLATSALQALLGGGNAAERRWVFADPETGLDALRTEDHPGHHLTPLRRLMALVKLERDDVWVAVIYAVGVGLLSLATPLGVQILVNTVAFGALLQPLLVLTTLLLFGLAFAGVLRALQAYVVERLQQRIFARVALDLAHRLPHVRLGALDGRHGPELMNRFFDVVTVQKGAATLLVDGISIALQTVVGTLLLAFYHPFLLAFDVVLLGSVALVFLLGRGAIPSAIKESKTKYSLAAWLQETARHVETFKLQGADALARRRAESLTRDYLAARNKHFKVLFRQIVGALVVQAAASAALLGIGGWLVIARQLTLGQLVAAELIVTAVVASFAKLGKYFEAFYDLVAAVDKLGHMVDLPTERGGEVTLGALETGLEVRASHTAVRHADGSVLSGVQFHLRPGEAVALIGESGSGKSSVVDALTGVRGHVGGRIDIDGIAIEQLSLAPLRRTMAIVRLDGLFAGTIDENVRLGRHEVSSHDARLALERLGIWDAVSALPEGVETVIATHGKGLCSDLAHRLVIARALAGRPRLLVLDGVLDVLGPAARVAVTAAVAAADRSWSIIVTTSGRHIPPWVDHAYAIDAGTLVPVDARSSAQPSVIEVA